jgi:hypothetical protein
MTVRRSLIVGCSLACFPNSRDCGIHWVTQDGLSNTIYLSEPISVTDYADYLLY